MKGKIIEYYKELPTWAKGVLVIGIVGVSYVFISQTIKRIRQQAQLEKDRKTIVNQIKEQDGLIKAGMTQSYPDSQYNSWADGIQKQFDSCDFSPENWILSGLFASFSGEYIYKIIKQLNNDLDFLKLSTAFDIRTYDQCGWGTGNFTGNLTQAVEDELSTSEITQLNNLLSQKGINYRF